MCSAIYQGMYSSVTARQELIIIFTTKNKLISKTKNLLQVWRCVLIYGSMQG